jgi:rhodanese-related sulfurtransferase
MIALALAPAFASAQSPPVEKITPTAAAQRAKEGTAILVDVRERNEIAAGMAEGAHWYPSSSIEDDPDAYKKFVESLPADRTLVFYCASGVRAGAAAEIARKELGRRTANFGGFKDWKASGLPVAIPKTQLDPG